MERRKDSILIGIIILLFGICFIVMRRHWIRLDGLPYLLLGGAFLLLYYTKQKSWAVWGALLFAGLWGRHLLGTLFTSSQNIGGIFLFLLPGVVLLHRYRTTGWEGYVVPGCFLLWGGCYVLLSNFDRYASWPCTTLALCLMMVFYTARNIKRKKGSMPTLFLRSALLFAICSVIAGLLW